MPKFLEKVQLVGMRDAYLEALGMSKDRPVWIGLSSNGKEICTRRVCPVKAVRHNEVEWVPRDLMVPKRIPGRKWWARLDPVAVTVFVSPAPASEKIYVLNTFSVLPGGTVTLIDLKLGVNG